MAGALFVFVLVQLLVPASYYLRDDPYDERFAWRMFSSVRVERCRTTAAEARGREVTQITLPRAMHAAWEQHMRRNRRAVIERFLEHRCGLGATRVRVENRCVDARGQDLPVRSFERDCAAGTVVTRSRR